jgi:DNA-binding NtrC family response regulator
LLVRRFVAEFSAQHDRPFHGIAAEAMALLVEYSWPGNVRELRNLVESMVVLAHGREIVADDIPRAIREGGGRRLLPVHVGPVVREGERAQGRELEFIVRSLVELKLQVEELRRRMDVEQRPGSVAGGAAGSWIGEVRASGSALAPVVDGPRGGPIGSPIGGPVAFTGGGAEIGGLGEVGVVRGIEPREVADPPTTIALGRGVTMAEIERQAILGALRDTGGNRRKAAEQLGIGERTLYRKLREYEGDLGADELGGGEET